MKNYKEYCNYETLQLTEEKGDLSRLLFYLIHLDLSINKNNIEQIEEYLLKLCYSVGVLTQPISNLEESEQLMEDLTKIWWLPQFVISNPQDEITILKSYVLQFYSLLKVQNKKPANYFSEIKRLTLHINTSLVSIALTSGLNPTQILHNSIKQD